MSKKRTGLENFFTGISGVDFIGKLDEEKKQKELQEQKKIEEATEKQKQIVAQREQKRLSETKKLFGNMMALIILMTPGNFKEIWIEISIFLN